MRSLPRFKPELDSPQCKVKGHKVHPILGNSSRHFRGATARLMSRRLPKAFLLGCLVIITVLYCTLHQGPLFEVQSNPRKLRGYSPVGAHEVKPAVTTCVGFQRTEWCSWLGRMTNLEPCDTVIERGSGYCLCGNNMTTKHISCGKHFFKCVEECKALDENIGLALPSPIVCQASDALPPPMWDNSKAELAVDTYALDKTTQILWDKIDVAYEANSQEAIKPPAIRTDRDDWVVRGMSMPRADVEKAKAQWQGFLRDAPTYPSGSFQGRGIVMIGGGMRYMMPAWVAVHMIRRSGCGLPIEMFFPVTEFPSVEMERYLTTLGVDCRKLQMRALDQTGFSIKVVGMLLSRFREVVFLDSDNVPIKDVTFLFDTPEYISKGIIMWKDYWASSAAPDLKGVLGIPHLPKGSHESGQMVFDKRRAWRGLLLAHFLNMQHELYYELLSNYMGKGDKETFAAAFMAVDQTFHTVASAPGSIGNMRSVCQHDGEDCHNQFFGNTMTQFDPSGKLLFLHTNLSPKWNVGVPDNFDTYYTRRWELLQPGNRSWVQFSSTMFGEDLERAIYGIIRRLYCAPFYASYENQRLRMGDVNFWQSTQFHNVIEGIDFVKAFRNGFSGNFQNLMSTNRKDNLRHFESVYIHPHESEIKKIQNFLGPLTHLSSKP